MKKFSVQCLVKSRRVVLAIVRSISRLFGRDVDDADDGDDVNDE